jgi:predicted nucleic acid-binding protein
MAPDLLWPEFANILWKAVKLGRISTALAREATSELLSLEIMSVPSLSLLDNAFTIAATFDRTVYDALHVAVAAQGGAPVITADDRLVNSLASCFPVQWLGAYRAFRELAGFAASA